MKTKTFISPFIIGLLIAVAISVGCKDKVEAVELKDIADPDNVTIELNESATTWMFEGTFCSGCNKLYNYIEHPKICPECNEQTKDFYYMALIKKR